MRNEKYSSFIFKVLYETPSTSNFYTEISKVGDLSQG